MKRVVLVILLISSQLASCNENGLPNGNSSSKVNPDDWLIPFDEVLDGGPGKDGIPSIDNPKFKAASEVTFLNDDDLVIGYKFLGNLKAFPHIILDWHEIVNDRIDEHLYAITYCPLTGTAINWGRSVGGNATTFGVSGLLYNSNLIPYDRASDSNWSQMKLLCVNGELSGDEPATFPIVETTWKTWRTMFPDSEVMTLETGISRPYGSYPYVTSNGDYRYEDYLIFPINRDDRRLDRKERVLGVISPLEVIAFRFSEFTSGIEVIQTQVGGEEVTIVGSEPDNFIVAFYTEGFTMSKFESDDEGIMQDQNGNIYDIFGFVMEGPNLGDRIQPTNSFIGYWFSWAVFYPDVTIYNF